MKHLTSLRWLFTRALLNVVITITPNDDRGRDLLHGIFDWMVEGESANETTSKST